MYFEDEIDIVMIKDVTHFPKTAHLIEPKVNSNTLCLSRQTLDL